MDRDDEQLSWWQRAVIYQVLVPSFADSDGDGTGDLPGLIDRLPHLGWLGVEAVWLSPIFASPMAELGYDVSDYRQVHRPFGSLADLDRLIALARERGIAVILDWVPNHTSAEHAWFREAAASRDNPRRDWYLWRDPAPDGGPPNNWVSVFGGSVWQWHEPTGQYYLHTFLPEQPDLNWRNPAVRAAIYDAMRFWLDRGVAGFRIDAACLIIKDEAFRDNPLNPDYDPGTDGPDMQALPRYTRNQPGLHEIMAEMRALVDERPEEPVLLGELYLRPEEVAQFYGGERRELHLPLDMLLTVADWRASVLGAAIEEHAALVPEGRWPAWTLSGHDCPRIAARTGGEQPRIAAMLLLCLRGTPVIYYGEELGMQGVPIPAEHARDPQGRRTGRNRDPARTPMQWDASPNAGFTSGEPWLPIGADRETASVAAQADDPGSLLTLCRRLIALRREHPTLARGDMTVASRVDPLLAVRRHGAGRSVMVILNLSHDPQSYWLQPGDRGEILLSTFLDRQEPSGETVALRPDEGVIVEAR